jgi:hypothetical protein
MRLGDLCLRFAGALVEHYRHREPKLAFQAVG